MTVRGIPRAAAVAGWAALLACASASATVYRCGNAYADIPCPQATVIKADDPRSDADRAAALEVARREAALAARMVADRESAERLLQPARPARAKAPARAASSAIAISTPKRSSRDRTRVNTDNDFVIVSPRKR